MCGQLDSSFLLPSSNLCRKSLSGFDLEAARRRPPPGPPPGPPPVLSDSEDEEEYDPAKGGPLLV